MSETAERNQDTLKRNELMIASIPYFEKALAIYPQFGEPLVYLGNIYYKLDKDHDKMFDYYIRALKVNSLNKDVWENTVGIMTYNLNDPPYEKKIWKIYTELSDYYESYYQLGILYKAEQNYDSAFIYLQQAYNRNKNHFDLMFHLADCYGIRSDFNNARTLLLECLRYKQTAEVYRMLGLTYGLQGDNINALNYFEKGIQLDPKNVELQNLIMRAKGIQ
jgi:tetratricopeptide (TPR) repeat protein